MVRTTRQTYSFFDLLGDVGGLTDSLYMLTEMTLSSYFAFARSSIVLTALFRVKLSTPKDQSDDQQTSRSKLGHATKIKRVSCLQYFFCFKSKKARAFKRLADRAELELTNGLDLKLFLRKQRISAIAQLCTLDAHQISVLSKMSRLTVSDGDTSDQAVHLYSSGSGTGDCEDNNAQTESAGASQCPRLAARHKHTSIDELKKSRNEVDKRLLKLLQLRKGAPFKVEDINENKARISSMMPPTSGIFSAKVHHKGQDRDVTDPREMIAAQRQLPQMAAPEGGKEDCTSEDVAALQVSEMTNNQMLMTNARVFE